uniref:Putative molecular chaperone ixodes scapularis molecular chaperone n=1 Tax=Amblyomma triste TaxID=251400 RepID=A0A023GMV3_AMBTT
MHHDHYTVLVIDRNSSEADIGRAYRRLALRYHPDKNKASDAEEKFKRLRDAYKVLSDKEKRDEYDSKLKQYDSRGDVPEWQMGTSFGFDSKYFWSLSKTADEPPGRTHDTPFRFGTSSSSTRTASDDPRAECSKTFNAPPWSGFRPSSEAQFDSRWSSPRYSRGAQFGYGTSSAGENISGMGRSRESNYSEYEPSFSGWRGHTSNVFTDRSANSRTRPERPRVKSPDMELDVFVTLEEVLTGTVKVIRFKRTVLAADGCTPIREEKVLSVRVEPGCLPGTKITFPREGDQLPDTIAADVVVTIRDEEHTHFTRMGADLYYTARISYDEAIRFYEAGVPTLAGAHIRMPLTLRNINMCYAYMLVSGGGLSHHDDPTERGDLRIHLEIANWVMMQIYIQVLPQFFCFCLECEFIALRGHSQ